MSNFLLKKEKKLIRKKVTPTDRTYCLAMLVEPKNFLRLSDTFLTYVAQI